jgi:hypothetical protein
VVSQGVQDILQEFPDVLHRWTPVDRHFWHDAGKNAGSNISGTSGGLGLLVEPTEVTR